MVFIEKHNVMNEVLERISKLRMQRHLSQEKISDDLNMSQAAYTKLERGETKLTVERLYQIAESLKTDISELLGIESKYNQDIHNNEQPTIIGHQEVENLYQENREMTEKLVKQYEASLADKDKLIAMLEDKLNLLDK